MQFLIRWWSHAMHIFKLPGHGTSFYFGKWKSHGHQQTRFILILILMLVVAAWWWRLWMMMINNHDTTRADYLLGPRAGAAAAAAAPPVVVVSVRGQITRHYQRQRLLIRCPWAISSSTIYVLLTTDHSSPNIKYDWTLWNTILWIVPGSCIYWVINMIIHFRVTNT